MRTAKLYPITQMIIQPTNHMITVTRLAIVLGMFNVDGREIDQGRVGVHSKLGGKLLLGIRLEFRKYNRISNDKLLAQRRFLHLAESFFDSNKLRSKLLAVPAPRGIELHENILRSVHHRVKIR